MESSLSVSWMRSGLVCILSALSGRVQSTPAKEYVEIALSIRCRACCVPSLPSRGRDSFDVVQNILHECAGSKS